MIKNKGESFGVQPSHEQEGGEEEDGTTRKVQDSTCNLHGN